MERRTLLAIGLILIVALVPMILFPPARPPSVPPGAVPDTVAPTAEAPPPTPLLPPAPAEPQPAAVPATETAAPAAERAVLVRGPLYHFTFSSRGARVTGAELQEYRTFAPGDTGRARIIPERSQFLEYRLVLGEDTLSLGDWSFEPSDTVLTVAEPGSTLRWTAARGPVRVGLEYTFRPDQYVFDVAGRITGVESGGLVLVGLGPGLALVDADSADDYRSYAVVTKAGRTEDLTFRALDPGERRALEGPFDWVAVKSKYFMAVVLAVDQDQPRIGGAVVTGGERSGGHATRADAVISLPAPGGQFGFSTYLGPQEFRRLRRIGYDLEDINPYGWIFRPIIRPFANLIVVILLWMRETLRLPYGWVLVLFGLAVRLVLWPLNQKAMRSSMAMQAIQPELKAVQERYKQDQQRMQQEVMKLYKEHGVNPLGGCLPLLIPMPVLFALFFVFRETIEFRGVPFLWLPDLSRADPFYIIPLVMGLSMFAVTKIGQIGLPPNPQTKMMLYIMPAFLTFIFLRFSSGLNLYYAVSNIASIPQQWLISRERLRRARRQE